MTIPISEWLTIANELFNRLDANTKKTGWMANIMLMCIGYLGFSF